METTFTVNVAGDNDAPVTADDSITTSEDASVTTSNVLTNDSDADGDPIHYSLTSGPAFALVRSEIRSSDSEEVYS